MRTDAIKVSEGFEKDLPKPTNSKFQLIWRNNDPSMLFILWSICLLNDVHAKTVKDIGYGYTKQPY